MCFSEALESQEHPVTSGTLKLHLHLEAVDTQSQSQAALDEEMSGSPRNSSFRRDFVDFH